MRVATICPRPSPPQWAPKRLTPRSRPQHSSTFPQSIRSHADCCRCLNMAVSKAAWWPRPLTFRPWKWCPSHVGNLCANFGLPSPLCSRLRPVCDRQTSDASSINAPAYYGRGQNNPALIIGFILKLIWELIYIGIFVSRLTLGYKRKYNTQFIPKR